jgi:LDH2 family malate/lactate/ureidoglycolate dehydrogenase
LTIYHNQAKVGCLLGTQTFRFEPLTLSNFCADALICLRVPQPHAQLIADSLVAANLRAVDSHGIQMLLPYIKQLELGSVDAETTGGVASASGACLTYDGNNGLGQVVANECTEHALRLVRENGLAMVVARNSNHFGTAAYWGQKMARKGCIGVVTTNASPATPPWQGKSARLGTNPLCMAVPGSEGGGWLLDMATTTVAFGKIHNAAYYGEAIIPSGWATNIHGNPTTDTQEALDGLATPLGGYKGSGLAMMVEILSAVLSGGPMSTEVGTLRQDGDERLRVSHMFLAIDARRFMSLESFQGRMARLSEMVKSAEPASGYHEVMIAGEPEWRAEQQRLRDGIPLPGRLCQELADAAKRLGIEPPLAIGATEATRA